MQILLLLLAVMRTWQSQDVCALSRHSELCKQSSWSRARNSQENRSFLTALVNTYKRITYRLAGEEVDPDLG